MMTVTRYGARRTGVSHGWLWCSDGALVLSMSWGVRRGVAGGAVALGGDRCWGCALAVQVGLSCWHRPAGGSSGRSCSPERAFGVTAQDGVGSPGTRETPEGGEED